MKTILIIAITLLTSSGEEEYFIDHVLRIPQTNIAACEEAKKDIRSNTYTNNSEYKDEYKFKIRGVWCVNKSSNGFLESP